MTIKKKIILWIPYVIAQLFLIAVIVWINLNIDISESDGYFIGGLIVTYGFLLILSQDIRRYYSKGDSHGS